MKESLSLLALYPLAGFFLDSIYHSTSTLKKEKKTKINAVPSAIILLLRLRRSPVSLPTIFEPIGDLGECKSRLFSERALLIGRWVTIKTITFFEGGTRFLLEAIDGFLSIPDGCRQRVLAS